jgi:uncharacterized protein YdeI (BOF family)
MVMKQTILMLAAFAISFGAFAQKKSKANHPTNKSEVAKINGAHQSKGQHAGVKAPQQVTNTFTNEYPNASNVVWTKAGETGHLPTL